MFSYCKSLKAPGNKLSLQAAQIPGVNSIMEDAGRMVVEFDDGVKATVVESFVAKLRREPSYDVFLPSSHGLMFAADVAPSLTADSVMKLLSELASKAVAKSSN